MAEFDLGEGVWDGIIEIFCPLPSKLRAVVHRRIECGLRPGGVFLAESYTPDQLKYGTGGGENSDTMQSVESLRMEFSRLNFTHLVETERDVIEGIYHTGLASVVQAIGRREV